MGRRKDGEAKRHHLSRRKGRDDRSANDHIVAGGQSTLTMDYTGGREKIQVATNGNEQVDIDFHVRDPFGGDRDVDDDGLDGCAPEAVRLDEITLRGGQPEALNSQHCRYLGRVLQLVVSDECADRIRVLDSIEQTQPTNA